MGKLWHIPVPSLSIILKVTVLRLTGVRKVFFFCRSLYFSPQTRCLLLVSFYCIATVGTHNVIREWNVEKQRIDEYAQECKQNQQKFDEALKKLKDDQTAYEDTLNAMFEKQVLVVVLGF